MERETFTEFLWCLQVQEESVGQEGFQRADEDSPERLVRKRPPQRRPQPTGATGNPLLRRDPAPTHRWR